MRLALEGGTILTSLTGGSLLEADVVLEDGRIVQLGEATGPRVGRDCSGCLILPGNICAHTHLYSALARGMPFDLEPPANFLQILQRVWWRLDRALDEEAIRASALVGGAEALLSGTTTLVDHHASPNAIPGSLDIVADALEEVGARSILCYEVTDRDGPARAQAGILENRRFARTDRPISRAMVGAHASFTLSRETLAGCVEVGREEGLGIHIHVAEDLVDEGDSEARFGMPVIERLAEAGALTDTALLAHCVHVHPSEMAMIQGSGATVAHNPRSNMNNGVGRAPVEAIGDRVALGTDGIGADMFAESQVAFWRAREEGLSVVPSWALDRLAEGARLAGMAFGEAGLGRIEAGSPADLVVLDYSPPAPISAQNLAAHWLFGISASRVRDVWVNGEMVVKDRRLTRVDQDEIAAKAMATAAGLWERLRHVPIHGFEPAGPRA
jgi:putative selenium metabolism protein SsnA